MLAGAELADAGGIESVTFAALASRLGVQAPALYRHVDSVADLHRRIATLAMTDLGDGLRDALQGRSGPDAIAGLFAVVQDYSTRHPGRYQATIGEPLHDGGDPLSDAAIRVVASVRAALSGYGLSDLEADHALRTVRCLLHGYASLQATDGFQWSNDPDDSVRWMVAFVDAGLQAVGSPSAG